MVDLAVQDEPRRGVHAAVVARRRAGPGDTGEVEGALACTKGSGTNSVTPPELRCRPRSR